MKILTNKQYKLFLAQQGRIEQLQKENDKIRKENAILNQAIVAQNIDFPNGAVKSTEIDVKV
mgnify:CR=1 FL=1